MARCRRAPSQVLVPLCRRVAVGWCGWCAGGVVRGAEALGHVACGMPEWRWLASWRLLAARSMVALCCRQAEKKAYELTYTPGGSAEEERPETRKACLYSDKQESILVLRCSNALMLWRVALIPCACAWGCRSGRGGDAGVTSTDWLRGWGRLGAGGGGRCRPGHARLYQRLAGLIAA